MEHVATNEIETGLDGQPAQIRGWRNSFNSVLVPVITCPVGHFMVGKSRLLFNYCSC